MADLQAGNLLLELHRPFVAGFHTGLGQNQQELFASVAAGNIPAPRYRAENRTQFAQQNIARFVTKGVVELLETIDVDHQDRHRLRISGGAQQFPVQRLLHVTTVEQASQGIADGLVFQSLAQRKVGEGQRHLLGHGGCQFPGALKQPGMGNGIAKPRIVDAQHAQRVALRDHGNTKMAGVGNLVHMAAYHTDASGLHQVCTSFAQSPTAFRSKRTRLRGGGPPTENNIEQIAR